jgi:predicted HTH domain antitoxin
MTLTLPDEPGLALFREDQLRLELACALYASRGIAKGLAARLAGMEQDDFETELHTRGISNGCKPADLDADLAVLDHLLKK